MIYRKQGSTLRWENGTLIRVTESGIAREQGELFSCEPARMVVDAAQSDVLPHVEIIRVAHDRGVTVERLILANGVATHEYGARVWTEEARRLHLALTLGRERALIDQATFDTAHIDRVARALGACEQQREPPPGLRLHASVTGALIPALLPLAPPNVRLVQTAGGIDGRGEDIVEATGPWPNWYRPSYRVRPVRTPLNLRLESGVTAIDESRPIAIALLAPVGGLTLRVLVEDGESAYSSVVRITRIDAVAEERHWYPYGAGSFGAEMML